MKRVLIVTRNFPPLWGGMERLNLHLVGELCRHCEVRLVAPQGADEHVPDRALVDLAPIRPLPRFLLSAAWRGVRQAFAWRPDVIMAGSGLTAPLALVAARLSGARAVAYVHGLDLVVPHPVYRALWLPSLRRLDGVIANSHATADLADGIGIDRKRISIVHPGVTLVKPDREAGARFRGVHKLGSGPLLLSVGRLTVRKGLMEFVAEVLPHIVKRHPDARLVVIGDAPTDSLYAEVQTQEQIQAAADKAGVGHCLCFLGKRFGSELSDAYFAADVHVFPVRQLPNDPEGFGMVAVEAAAHGLQTAAYSSGGVVDAVADGVSGRLVASGHPDEFAQAVLALLAEPIPAEMIRGFAEGFSWEHFGERIKEAISDESC